jgi:plastocyanin
MRSVSNASPFLVVSGALAALVLASALPLPAFGTTPDDAAAEFAAAAQDGTWLGDTGQARVYRVKTLGNQITEIQFGYALSGCSGTTTLTISPPPTIDSNNHFSASGAFCAAGTFSTSGTFNPSSQTATGALALSATPIPSLCGCSGSLNTTWTAALNPPDISIGDASVIEGNTATTLLGFNVTLSKPSSNTITVGYGTCGSTCGGGTAVADVDYKAKTEGTEGTVTFAPGQTSRAAVVEVVGDTTDEPNETFSVNLSSAADYAGIAKGTGVGTIVNDDPATAASLINMYRLYADNLTFEHLYTTDLNEYNVLGAGYDSVNHRGWLQEGIAYKLLNNGGTYNGAFGIPLYRLYNVVTRQHHWTTDANEGSVLSGQADWNYEGIVGYVVPEPTTATGVTPLYRLWDTGALHLWTTDLNEKDVLSTQRGWNYEGVIGNVIVAGAPDLVITIQGINGSMSFSPASASVKAGQTVSWHNADSITHTATQNGGQFNTNFISPGSTSPPILMTTTGTFPYHCAIHSTMVGTLTVTP